MVVRPPAKKVDMVQNSLEFGYTFSQWWVLGLPTNPGPRKSLEYKYPAEFFTLEGFDFKQHHAAIFDLQP